MEVIQPNDGLKGLGNPPLDETLDENGEAIDPREALLEEARGGAPDDEPVDDEPPVEPTEIDVLRAELAESQRRMAHRFAEEKEKRRRITRRAEALERQVHELVSAREAATQPSHIRLEYDDDGKPILPVAALRQATAPTQRLPQAPNGDTSNPARDAYERIKSSLIDEDDSYDGIFSRLETLTKDVVVGIQEAVRDGELAAQATTDDVVEYLDTSDLGATLRKRYPEVPDWESLVPAISSTRAARRLAERIHQAKGKNGHETPTTTPKGDSTPAAPARKPAPVTPTPPTDLTGAVRARIRDKAQQARTRTVVVDGINLEDAAKLSPEELLALPASTRDKVKAAVRKTLAPG